jgi:hypothetical protein
MNQPTYAPGAPFSPLRDRPNLGRLLSQVLAAFGRVNPVAFSGPDVVAARLDTLSGPLRAHFDEIERSGLLERLEEQLPDRAELCSRLRREHRSLLQQLDRLRTASAIERRGGWWSAEVRALVEELTRHEAHEAGLVGALESGA